MTSQILFWETSKLCPACVCKIIEELETTGTFKLKKNDLREEAFHLEKVGQDQIFIKKPGEKSYVPLESDYYEVIMSGSAGF